MADRVRGKGGVPAEFLAAIAAGQSIPTAAAVAGTSERNAYRWLNRPGVREGIDALRSEMTGQALGRLTNGMAAASDALVALLESKQEGIRLAAARTLISIGLDVRKSVELDRRLADIEKRLHLQAEGRLTEYPPREP